MRHGVVHLVLIGDEARICRGVEETGESLGGSTIIGINGQDVAINIAPDLEAKTNITQDAINLARALGVEKPKVGRPLGRGQYHRPRCGSGQGYSLSSR